MPFFIVLPMGGDVVVFPVDSPMEEQALLTSMFGDSAEIGYHYGGVSVVADGNSFNRPDWPMNRYVAGIPGSVILANNGVGFTQEEVVEEVSRLKKIQMTPEEAETHRPPQIKPNFLSDKHLEMVIYGTSTPQGMFCVEPFIDSIKAMVVGTDKIVTVRYAEKECPAA